MPQQRRIYTEETGSMKPEALWSAVAIIGGIVYDMLQTKLLS